MKDHEGGHQEARDQRERHFLDRYARRVGQPRDDSRGDREGPEGTDDVEEAEPVKGGEPGEWSRSSRP